MIQVFAKEDALYVKTDGYDPVFVQKVKAIPGRSYTGRETKLWRVPHSQVDTLLAVFPNAWLDDSVSNLHKKERLRDEIKKLGDAEQPLDVVRTLRPFQRVGVAWLRTIDCALLKDDPGLGKSCQSIAWANQHLPCLIVCPATMKWKYAEEIEETVGDSSVAVVEGRSGDFPPESTKWVVINWDIIGHPNRRETLDDAEELRTRLNQILAFGFHSVIFSEAHLAKSAEKSLRGDSALTIAEHTPRRLCETATPSPNRTEELSTILRLLGKLPKEKVWAWKLRYCEGHQIVVNRRGKRVWDFSGSSNTEELARMIEPFTLGRKRVDVLKELPPVEENPVIIEITNREEYENHELQVRFFLSEASREDQKNTKEGEKEAMRLRGKALGWAAKLSLTAAMGKVDAVAEMARPYLLARRKLIVFCEYLEPLQALHRTFGEESILLTGALADSEERSQAVETFQKDPSVLVALCSRRAFGASVTLTAADTEIFMTLPPTPTEYIQARDRFNRIGQTSNRLQAFWMIGRRTHDAAILNIIWPKAGVIWKLYNDPEMKEYAERFRETVNLLAKSKAA